MSRLKEIAAAIYEMEYHERVKIIAALHDDVRWIVQAHIENFAKQAQDENRRRNAIKAGARQ